ncbi:MAG: hypothetical protein JEY79_19315 [Pseudodesulfovibrio sp.]|nr:hypothetical protein [Pseudodesulfovibrio sp.]
MLSMLSKMQKDRRFELSRYCVALIITATLSLVPCHSNASELDEIATDVARYFIAVHGERLLSDYYYFEGEGAETELEYELDFCKSLGNAPQSDICVKYNRCRWQNQETTISYYFIALSRFIPHGKIGNITFEKGPQGVVPSVMVHVEVGDHTLSFFRSTQENEAVVFGKLNLSMIDGKKIFVPALDLSENFGQDPCKSVFTQ